MIGEFAKHGLWKYICSYVQVTWPVCWR